MLSIKDLKKYAGEIVTVEELDEIMESEHVQETENCGESGLHLGYTWYNVIFTNGTEMSVYLKRSECPL